MATEIREPDETFVEGRHYNFNSPIETNCFPVGTSKPKWERKEFTEGWCIGFKKEENAFVFQGKPAGEKKEYYFLVEQGKGSVARDISASHLKRIK